MTLEREQAMKIPDILWDYLDSTEQDPDAMSKDELLEEAKHVASPDGNWIRMIDERGVVIEDYEYTPQQIGALTRFINRLSREVASGG